MPDDQDRGADLRSAPDQRDDARPGPGRPLTEPAWPASPSAGQAPASAWPPPAPPAPPGPTGPYAVPYGAPYAPQRPPFTPAERPRPLAAAVDPPPRSRPSGWIWPAVCVLALVVGLGGGVLGGSLVGGDDTATGSGGILRVEKRTAAPLPADNDSVAQVAARLVPSTVQVVAEYDGSPRGATGSGWVLDRQGHVVTNNHVVAQADEDHGNIEIVDPQGRRAKARVVGRSTVYDVAVLQTDAAKRLTPVRLGSSTQMRVGETVVAIGSPLGLSSTVTSGIVSALHRPVSTGDGDDDQSYINAVQTDAAINPGNSGGPLVDLQGQVVGMNSAIASVGSGSGGADQGGSIGVGFAIPIEQIEVTADQILTSGRAEYPFIGASVGGTAGGSRDVDGALIRSVSDGEPASRAGLRAGDVVTRIDGTPVTDGVGLIVAVRSHQRGDRLRLTVQRDGAAREVVLTLAGRPDAG